MANRDKYNSSGLGYIQLFSMVFSVLAGLVWGVALYYKPILAVTEVRVQGSQVVDGTDVAQNLDLAGKSILALDVANVRKRVKESPWVKEVQVRRRLPGVVVIQVEERKAALVWRAAGRSLLVDGEGVVLDKAPDGLPLLSITDLKGEMPAIGGAVDPDAAALALSLTQTLPQETGAAPTEFKYAKQDGVTVLTDRGWSASFGQSNDLGYKLAVLKAVLPEAARACPQGRHIDLRYGGRPFFRCV